MIGFLSSPSIAIAFPIFIFAAVYFIHFSLAFQYSPQTHRKIPFSRYSRNKLLPPTTIKMTAFEHSNGSTDYFKKSPFQSLQNFVTTLNENPESNSICQLISSDDEDEILESRRMNSTITEINTIIFCPALQSLDSCDTTYAVAIVPSSNKIDVRYLSEELSKLQGKDEVGNVEGNSNNHYDQWELAPAQTVRDLCGYEPGTIPPLLVPHRKDGALDSGFEETNRPFATIIDSSLLWRSNNTKDDESNERASHLLLGGGGSVEHRCLIDVDFLVKRVLDIDNSNSGQSSTRNTKIASIIRFDGGMTLNAAVKPPSSSLSVDGNKDRFGYFTEKKPFFQIAPPPGSLVGEGSTKPHRPTPVTAIGRLTSVRQIAKKLVFADFAPPDYNYNEWLVNKNENSSTVPNGKNYDKSQSFMPWRSGEDGKDMYVQIIIGKTFCERFEDGTSRLKSLKAGKLVLVRGAANVDPMQKNGWRNSSGNWAQKRSLDIIVSSFEILEEDDRDDSLRMLVEEAQKEVASRGTSNASWNTLLPWERKYDFERRAVAGASVANSVTVPGNDDYGSGNTLTLARFNSHLQDSPLSVNIVDDEVSMKDMADDVKQLMPRVEAQDEKGDLLDFVAGIDCEWRPTGAYTEAVLGGPDDNPVALLQISLPAIGKVYLVDTHRTLRANLADTEAMSEMESMFSGAIGAIFGSETMLKAGYNVAIDFRRLAASFPHMPSFQNVRSVVELSTLAERLHPKSARPHLGSLQKLTKLVLGYDIAKEEQCSDWESRPLTSNQIEYATLDCVLPPRLLDEMAEGSGNAKIREVIPGVAKTWRFQTIDSSQKDAIRRLKAKRVVGNTFLVSQSWLTRSTALDPISIPEEGGGPYTDTDGILKMPADLIRIGDENSSWRTMSGKMVPGGKKKSCIDLLVGDAMPQDAILDYNPRSGFITFEDGLALFVNLPDPSRPSRRRMPYPNEWLEGGKFLTWYIRNNDWEDGNSEVAKLLTGSNSGGDSGPSSVVLFARIGNENFVCCGSCTALIADDEASKSNKKKLVKLNLRINDWESIKDAPPFSQLLNAAKPKQSRSRKEDPASLPKNLAQAIVDGNIVGAFGMALDASNISPTERSLVKALDCAKRMLEDSDDPLTAQAYEIIKSMTL